MKKKGKMFSGVGGGTCSSVALMSFLSCACVCVGLLCSSLVSVQLKQWLYLICQLKSVSNHTLPVVRLLLPLSTLQNQSCFS